jgi:hypothetical protein
MINGEEISEQGGSGRSEKEVKERVRGKTRSARAGGFETMRINGGEIF